MRSSHRLALAGVAAAALLAAGCSSSGSSGGSSGGTNWATQTSASAGGGMNALVAAAKKEGTLNVIAIPPTWANYGAILKGFTDKYGIKINSTLPDGSSQQEVNAIKTENGTAKAPDVVDVGQSVALANTSLFTPYKVATWSDIPDAQKDANGVWYEDYGGYMAVGYSSSYGTISSLNDLLGPKFKGAVALNGNPTSANAALNGVMMASLAEGGSPGSISQGVDFFKKLKAAGNFNPVQATGATIKAGTTKVVFNWDYLNLPSYV
ncbi:MAG TPA: ABC transporter substrate-binding protein, partial [Streptosporangiaceae bacterium]|nr:ABC transporter substrate-binding protein [Streptosporangiaceae bacterium]